MLLFAHQIRHSSDEMTFDHFRHSKLFLASDGAQLDAKLDGRVGLGALEQVPSCLARLIREWCQVDIDIAELDILLLIEPVCRLALE